MSRRKRISVIVARWVSGIMQRRELVDYLTALLQPSLFKDYAPNGLQVEGRADIQRIVTGVTASQDLLDAAIAVQADTIIVHHGYFWRGEDPCIVGMRQRRIKLLLQHDINLLAYHLPLDAHPSVGNNYQLGQLMGVTASPPASVNDMVWQGKLAKSMSVDQFKRQLDQGLARESLHIAGGVSDTIERVAWCTGAAQDFLQHAVLGGADAYVTGEVSERTVHEARELGIHFFAAGHHATERYGVQALGEHLADRFGVWQQFIDIDNPV